MMAKPPLLEALFERAPVTFLGAAGLCMCSEHLTHVRWWLNCARRWPSCTCARPQPRAPMESANSLQAFGS
eukprot:15434224-Alexandrium_andersonii.AAC.1